MSRHLAIGPDGGTLLGVLAALGMLAVLDRAWAGRGVRLGWQLVRGGWRPVVDVDGDHDDAALVDAIDSQLRADGEPPGREALGEDLSVPPEVFKGFATRAALSAALGRRREADFAIALGCEATHERGRIQDTALRTMGGAGHQHFLGSMAELASLTTRADIEAALLREWEYRDERPSMRWDPVDDRRYAYRADDPAKSRQFPIRTVRGANRLAVEALPFFPSVPQGARLATTGFIQAPRTNASARTRWLVRWPIWLAPSSASVVRSLMTFPELTAETPDFARLQRMGVVEVFEAERLTEGQFRSFTPARALLGSASAMFRPAVQAGL